MNCRAGRGSNPCGSSRAAAEVFAMSNRTRLIVPAALACLLGATAWAAENAPTAAGEPQSAVWTEKELTFVYQGFTTRYSCDGLRDKVRGVLLDLGAQKKGLK